MLSPKHLQVIILYKKISLLYIGAFRPQCICYFCLFPTRILLKFCTKVHFTLWYRHKFMLSFSCIFSNYIICTFSPPFILILSCLHHCFIIYIPTNQVKTTVSFKSKFIFTFLTNSLTKFFNTHTSFKVMRSISYSISTTTYFIHCRISLISWTVCPLIQCLSIYK